MIIALIVFPILFMVLSAWGEKSGVEFSPDDFSMRSFDYCRLPLIGWTRRGIKYKDVDNATAEMLISDDWIRATGRNPKRWHLVSESIPALISQNRAPAACDARFLTTYFDLTDKDGNVQVVHWTDENPESAKIFWPIIAEMARDSLYLPIPELIQFVVNYPKPDKDETFEDKLNERVGEIWYQAGMTDQLKGQHERAIERFDMAIAKNPAHIEAAEAKKQSESSKPASP